MTLYDFINNRLAELGVKRSDLIDKFDLDWSTLSNIGRGKMIRESTKQKLAHALKCSIGDINARLAESAPKKAAKKEPSVMATVDKLEQMVKEEHPEDIPGPDPGDYGFAPVEVEKDTSNDVVNHPAHYTQGGIECIEAIKASMTEEEFRGYLKGCQMKYMWRYRLKGGVEDLKKARWYLDRLIGECDKC